MGANDLRGTANLDPRGIVGRIYVGDHQTSLHTCFVSYAPHSFREEDFLMFFSYIALYKHMTPWGEASLEPSGFVSKIYVGDHLRLLYTKYISCGPQAFREEDFFDFFFPLKSMGTNDPRGVASLDPRGLIGRIYVGDH